MFGCTAIWIFFVRLDGEIGVVLLLHVMRKPGHVFAREEFDEAIKYGLGEFEK